MGSAFSSPRQAVAFAALVILVLVGPLLVARTGWLRREQVYPAVPMNYGTFPFVHQKIFQEHGPVDLAFVGSSGIWSGIDTPLVAEQLSARLGRRAEVFTLGWPWPGYDAVYVVAKDLIERRQINTLVIYDEPRAGNAPHLRSSFWFRVGETSDAFAGLPIQAQVGLYGSAVLGLPRQLVSVMRPNLVEDPSKAAPNMWTQDYRAPHPPTRLGTLTARRTYPWKEEYTYWLPPGPTRTAGAVVYSETSRGDFDFSETTPVPYREHFLGKLVDLARIHHVKLLLLHVPDIVEDKDLAIKMRQSWPQKAGPLVFVGGVRPKEFFGGLTQDELVKLYYERGHLNESGQQYFTRMIMPVLEEVHARPAPR